MKIEISFENGKIWASYDGKDLIVVDKISIEIDNEVIRKDRIKK